MKKKCIGIIFLTTILSFSSLSAARKAKLNILDYYKMIPKRLILGEKYKLVTKKDEKGEVSWGIRDPAYGNAFFPMVVDFKNGFIELEFSGAGYSRQQIVLFIAKSGKRYIGLSYEGSHLFGVSRATLHFYRVDDKSWEDVSSKILPAIPHEKFFNNKKWVGKIEEVKRILSPLPLFSYSLPRWGLIMKMELILGNLEILIRQKEKRVTSGKFAKISIKNLRYLKKFYKEIENKKVMFRWDKNKGIFVFAGMKRK